MRYEKRLLFLEATVSPLLLIGRLITKVIQSFALINHGAASIKQMA
jgi:hypothetical protein